jgi:hypothetical protein
MAFYSGVGGPEHLGSDFSLKTRTSRCHSCKNNVLPPEVWRVLLIKYDTEYIHVCGDK